MLVEATASRQLVAEVLEKGYLVVISNSEAVSSDAHARRMHVL